MRSIHRNLRSRCTRVCRSCGEEGGLKFKPTHLIHLDKVFSQDPHLIDVDEVFLETSILQLLNSRFEDQRGTEICFEIPEFLRKPKEERDGQKSGENILK